MENDTLFDDSDLPSEVEDTDDEDAAAASDPVDVSDETAPEEALTDEAGAWFETPDELKPAPAWALPPDLVRDRPQRRKLVPRWVWGAIAGTLAGIALMVAGVLFLMSRSVVIVPDVTNTSLGVASTRLAQIGLGVAVEERRFSSVPPDTVLGQTPAAGSSLKRGDRVGLIISAGSEEFSMPDVVGLSLIAATGTLEGRGLVVRIEAVPSELPSDTILLSSPSAGSAVRTGDIVTLQVASTSTTGQYLKPYALAGTTFVIDPAPAISGAPSDVTMDIARRLRSLLEASGSTVVLTRSGNDTATIDDASRERTTLESSATALVGLDVAATGAAGRIVFAASAGQPQTVFSSRQLASTVASELAKVAAPALVKDTTSDSVFTRAVAPWVRVQVGSLTARPDTQAFADPAWADSVARSIYIGLGEHFALGATP